MYTPEGWARFVRRTLKRHNALGKGPMAGADWSHHEVEPKIRRAVDKFIFHGTDLNAQLLNEISGAFEGGKKPLAIALFMHRTGKTRDFREAESMLRAQVESIRDNVSHLQTVRKGIRKLSNPRIDDRIRTEADVSLANLSMFSHGTADSVLGHLKKHEGH
jgi:hypothetical protein